jgi:hypothetical protein
MTKNGADFITFYYIYIYIRAREAFVVFRWFSWFFVGFRGFSLVFVGPQRKCPIRLGNRRNHLHLPFLQRAESPARGHVLGPNRSHSHSLIRGLHGEDLNGGG